MKRASQIDIDNIIVAASVIIIGIAAYFLTSAFRGQAEDIVNAGTNS